MRYPLPSTTDVYRQFHPRALRCPLPNEPDRRLLVIEDDEDLWPLIGRVGCAIDSRIAIDYAATVNEAVDKLCEPIRYDAVLVDNCLPRPGVGAQLRVPIETLQPWARTAMMSGRTCPDVESWNFLPKPFSFSQCRSFLHRLLS